MNHYIIRYTCSVLLWLAWSDSAIAQLEARAPPVLGFVKQGQLFALEFQKEESGVFYAVLLRTEITSEHGEPGRDRINELHIKYLQRQARFLPWRVGHGSIWLNDGDTVKGVNPIQGVRIPEEDLALYGPKLDWERFKKKYANNLVSGHYCCLGTPVSRGQRRAFTNDGEQGPCYFDAVPFSETQIVCLILAAGRLSVWQGKATGPREMPTCRINWEEVGKESKSPFDESFVAFRSQEDLVIVTESGKAYRVKVPSGDRAVAVNPIWVHARRPLESIITDVDGGISYALAAPTAGSKQGHYFALLDTDRQTAFDAPPLGTGIEQVLRYARILLKDGKLRAGEKK
jgi:hypothetical protein